MSTTAGVLDKATLKALVQFIQEIEAGRLDNPLALEGQEGFDEETLVLVKFLNDHVGHLRSLGQFMNEFKDEIALLVEGIQDVLQTIEKSTIRVLDNTDGILEQKDLIEKTNDLLKHNPALYRVFGTRIDKIHQAQSKGRMFVFDIIQAQEFQELTRKQTEKLVGVLQAARTRLLDLQKLFHLHEQAPLPQTAAQIAAEEAEAPAKANQDLVDQLLAEFGL